MDLRAGGECGYCGSWRPERWHVPVLGCWGLPTSPQCDLSLSGLRLDEEEDNGGERAGRGRGRRLAVTRPVDDPPVGLRRDDPYPVSGRRWAGNGAGAAPAALERPGWEPRGSCRRRCGRPASRVQRPVARDGHAGRAVGRVCGGARGADAPATAQSATDGMPHDNGHERRAAPVVAGGEGRRRARRGLHQVVLLIFSDNNLVNRFILYTCFDCAHSQIIGSGRHGHGCSACGVGTMPRPMLSSSRPGGALQRRLAGLRLAMHVIFAK